MPNAAKANPYVGRGKRASNPHGAPGTAGAAPRSAATSVVSRLEADLAIARAQLQKKETEVSQLTEQNEEVTQELSWLVRELVALRKVDNDKKCSHWLERSEGLSTVLACPAAEPAEHSKPQHMSDGDGPQERLTKSALQQLAGNDGADAALEDALAKEDPSPDLMRRLQDAWHASRNQNALLQGRMLRLQAQAAAGSATEPSQAAVAYASVLPKSAEIEKTGPASTGNAVDAQAKQTASVTAAVDKAATAAAEADASAARAARDEARRDEAEARTALNSARATLESHAATHKALEQRLAATTVERDTAVANEAALRSSTDAQIAAHRAQITTLSSELAAAQSAAQRSAGEAEHALKVAAEADVRAALADTRCTQAESRALEAESDARAARAAADELRERAERAASDAQDANTAHSKEVEALNTRVEAAERRTEELEGEAAQAHALEAAAREAVARLQRELEEVRAALVDARAAASEGRDAGDAAARELERVRGLLTKREDRIADLAAEASTMASQRLAAQVQRDRAAEEARAAAEEAKAARWKVDAAGAEAAEARAAVKEAAARADAAEAHAAAAEQKAREARDALGTQREVAASAATRASEAEATASALLERERAMHTERDTLRTDLASARANAEAAQAAADDATARLTAAEARRHAAEEAASAAATRARVAEDGLATAHRDAAALEVVQAERDRLFAAVQAAEEAVPALQERVRALQVQLDSATTSGTARSAELDAKLDSVTWQLEQERELKAAAAADARRLADELCSAKREQERLVAALGEAHRDAANAAKAGDSASSALVALRRRADAAANQARAEEIARCEAEAKVAAANIEKNALSVRLNEAVSALEDLRRMHADSESQRGSLQEQLQAAQASVITAKDQMQRGQHDLESLKTDSSSKDALLDDLSLQVQRLQEQSDAQQLMLTKLRGEVDARDAETARRHEKLRARATQLESEVTRVRLANHKLKSEHMEAMAKATAHEFQLADMFDKSNLEHMMGKLKAVVRRHNLRLRPSLSAKAAAPGSAATPLQFMHTLASVLTALESLGPSVARAPFDTLSASSRPPDSPQSASNKLNQAGKQFRFSTARAMAGKNVVGSQRSPVQSGVSASGAFITGAGSMGASSDVVRNADFSKRSISGERFELDAVKMSLSDQGTVA